MSCCFFFLDVFIMDSALWSSVRHDEAVAPPFCCHFCLVVRVEEQEALHCSFYPAAGTSAFLCGLRSSFPFTFFLFLGSHLVGTTSASA